MSESDKPFSTDDLPDLEKTPSHWITKLMDGEVTFNVPPAADPLINTMVGNFKIMSLLGEGGFGKVYKARDTALGSDVAIKFLWGVPSEERCILFAREAKAIAALRKHPNIVSIFQWGELEGKNYIVLEYVADNLVRLLEEHPNGLPVPLALRIVMECAKGLQEAHSQQILHRDIKPANILIEPDTGTAKLTDFGLARYGKPSDFTITGRISGSPSYMSPEQASAKPVDERSDIFSLGATLYEILSGKRPFDGATIADTIECARHSSRVHLHEHRPDLSKAVCAIVEKAMAIDPGARFQTAGAMAHEIKMVLNSIERSGEANGSSTGRRQIFPANRWAKPGVAAAGIAVVLLVCVLAAFQHGRLPSANTNEPLLKAAVFSLNKEDFSAAAARFKEILQHDPKNDLALYGCCLALAKIGSEQEAAKAATAIQTPELRTDAQAAMAFLAEPDKARTSIQAMSGENSTKYLQSLLARLDIMDGNYADAVNRLDGITEEQFPFSFQYADALEAVGQAQYHLGQYADAKAAFEKVTQHAQDGSTIMAKAYLTEIESQLDERRRENIQAKAAEIRRLMDQAETPLENIDEWTSRPLTFAILPGEVKRSRLAVESGVSDLLPSLLGARLVSNTPMQMVDRELIRELLAEQALSGMLSTNEGKLRLGQVMGARLLVRCDFTRIGANEKALVIVNDTETTERIPVPVLDMSAPVIMDTLFDSLALAIWENISKHYPIQGRLYAGSESPEINIGAAVGVRPKMIFDIHIAPNVPPIAGAVAVVQETPGTATTKVTLVSVDAGKLGTAPENGWFVREQRGGVI